MNPWTILIAVSLILASTTVYLNCLGNSVATAIAEPGKQMMRCLFAGSSAR